MVKILRKIRRFISHPLPGKGEPIFEDSWQLSIVRSSTKRFYAGILRKTVPVFNNDSIQKKMKGP
jgi:hypothetical protein